MTIETDRRTALVTGGARRIGRAIVRDLAAHGWAVVIHCNNSVAEAEAEAQAAGALGHGGRVHSDRPVPRTKSWRHPP